jgi:hypothetical protein
MVKVKKLLQSIKDFSICEVSNFLEKMGLNKENIKKINIKRVLHNFKSYIKNTLNDFKEKCLVFFSSIKQDPQFISLDMNFINNPNNETYLNLVTYINNKHKEFKKSLDLDSFWKLTLTIYSDDFIPMFNSDKKKENTYFNYTQGNIKFNSREEYVANISSLSQGFYEKTLKIKKIPLSMIISEKLGQSIAERLQVSGLGIGAIGFVLIILSALLFLFGGPTLKDIGAILFLIGFLLEIIGVIIFGSGVVVQYT